MPDKLRDAAHARRRRGRSPLGGWARLPYARAKLFAKGPSFAHSSWAGALIAPHWPEECAKVSLLRKRYNLPCFNAR